MQQVDLHIHTSASDGELNPRQVGRAAANSPLDFLSITDHNSMAGLGPAREGLDGSTRLVPGVELSAQPADGDEIHLLGYGIDPECEALREACRQITRRKHRQIREIGRRLRAVDVPVTMEELLGREDATYIGRPVLARMLVQQGVVRSAGQAFRRYLGRDSPCFVQMEVFEPRRCIQAIHAAGGLAVLAHPRIWTVDAWIEPLGEMGLEGIEVYRPACSGNQLLYIEKAVEHFGLLATGGSDWHGRDRDPPLGTFSVSRRQISAFMEALSERTR